MRVGEDATPLHKGKRKYESVDAGDEHGHTIMKLHLFSSNVKKLKKKSSNTEVKIIKKSNKD